MFDLNQNIASLKESATLAINQKAAELLEQGEAVFRFGFGQSPFFVHEKIQQAFAEHVAHNEYLPTLGLPQLREAICSYNKLKFDYEFNPERLIVGPGSKELIFQLLAVLEGPLIVPAPSWVSYGPQAELLNKKWLAVQTKLDNGYKLTADELTEVCLTLQDAKQKILIINSPNNPTGSVYTDDEIIALTKVCRAHRVVVISDEIYSLVHFDKHKVPSFVHHYPEGTFHTSGLSKAYSGGGYRLGYLAAPKEAGTVMTGLKAYASETFSAVTAPLQYAATVAYSNDADIEGSIVQCKNIHHAVLSYAYKRLVEAGFECAEPKGGFYLFPSARFAKATLLKKGITGATSLCTQLMTETHVAALPATAFYSNDDSYAMRLALVDYNGRAVYDASLKANTLDDEFVATHCGNIKEGIDRLISFVSGSSVA